MLKADWFAASETEIYPRIYPAGTVLTGELLERARALGLLVEDDQKPARKVAAQGRAGK
jgi:hypothetical protein